MLLRLDVYKRQVLSSSFLGQQIVFDHQFMVEAVLQQGQETGQENQQGSREQETEGNDQKAHDHQQKTGPGIVQHDQGRFFQSPEHPRILVDHKGEDELVDGIPQDNTPHPKTRKDDKQLAGVVGTEPDVEKQNAETDGTQGRQEDVYKRQGVPAKGYKTRNPKKTSSKFILERSKKRKK